MFAKEWNLPIREWEQRGSVVLHDELQRVLTRTAMSWARDVIDKVRSGTANVPPDSPVARVAAQTNHDLRIWSEPNRFRPERFRDWPGDPYTLIPQGSGEYLADHRCAENR